MKHIGIAVVAGFALSVSVSGPASAALTFDPFVTSSSLSSTLGNTAAIGFSYAGNKFVGSVYFGSNNNQLYQTDLNGGSVAKFGTPVSGFSGEIYVSSSLGLGGFASRNVFAGSEASNSIVQFANDGSTQATFVTLPNTPAGAYSGNVRGIGFDPYGQYGYDMIVTTNAGNVYRVTSGGVATFLANVGGDAEGLDFAPQQFGNIAAGTLVVLAEGTGRLNAITTGGVKTDLGLQFATPEMLSFVPLNLGISGNPLEGFYAANYNVNVIKAGASQFTPYLGDAILTEEGTHNVYQIEWNGTQFVKNLIGAFPNQPEDGIFVTAAILNPGCEITNTCGGTPTSVPEPGSAALFGAALAGLAWTGRRRRQ